MWSGSDFRLTGARWILVILVALVTIVNFSGVVTFNVFVTT